MTFKKTFGTILLVTTMLGTIVSSSGVALADSAIKPESNNITFLTGDDFQTTGGIDPNNPILVAVAF